jgi:FtsP/CotA-like multicopper oxidase with cupredoxin domain
MLEPSTAGRSMTSPLPSPTRRDALAGIAATILVSGPSPAIAQATPAEPTVTLTAAPARRRLRPEPAAETEVWAYNGEVPGPLIRLKQGQPARIRLENRLPQPTTLHFSGLRAANAADGVAGLTQQGVPPGGSFVSVFTPQDAGVSLYHPLLPTEAGLTAEQLERGLAGMMVVEEANWNGEIDREIMLMLDDWRLTEAHQVDPVFRSSADNARIGRLGNTLTVNGRPTPEVLKLPPRSRVRLRIGGIMNARILPMTFRGQAKATVIGIDGQPCEAFDPLRRQVIVAPGSRYDMVLDMPEAAGGEVTIAVALGDGIPVMRLVADGDPAAAKKPVPDLPRNPGLPEAILLQSARRAEFNIGGGWDPKDPAGPGASADVIARRLPDAGKVWTLNFGFPSGVGGKPLFSVKKGSVVVVALVNRASWPQVIRTHGHVFRVLHALDDGWEPFFLDTVVVPDGRTVRIAFTADNVGKWLIRSTVIEHMEGGVQAWFEVTG